MVQQADVQLQSASVADGIYVLIHGGYGVEPAIKQDLHEEIVT